VVYLAEKKTILQRVRQLDIFAARGDVNQLTVIAGP
jgi:hypothetical protein